MKKETKTRGWPPERRAKQAKNIRKTRPWEKATGPKTATGKEAVKHNGYKHGARSEEYREICRLLRAHSAFIKALKGSTQLPK